MRVAEVVDPGPLVVTGRVHDQRVPVPTTGGVSPPPCDVDVVWLGKLAPVHPDRAKAISTLEMLIDAIREYDEFDRIGIENRPRHPHRIARAVRVISEG